jgi:hypothetical protein
VGDALDLPFGKELNRLPSLDRPELKKLAGRVSSWLSQAFCDFTDTLDGATQDDEELARRAGLAFVHLGELVKLINFTAPYWGAYLADKLTERQAHSGILRMMAPEWWYLRLSVYAMCNASIWPSQWDRCKSPPALTYPVRPWANG